MWGWQFLFIVGRDHDACVICWLTKAAAVWGLSGDVKLDSCWVRMSDAKYNEKAKFLV